MNSFFREPRLVLLALSLCITPQVVGAQTTHDVTMGPGAVFNPTTLTIEQGDIVRWINTSPIPHTSTSGTLCSPSGLWDSGVLYEGASYSRVFNEAPGTLPYYCIPHCLSAMVGWITIDVVTGIRDPGNPPEFTLHQNAPNPFSLLTRIEYEVGTDAHVEIHIYNLMGQRVSVVENTARGPGRYLARWDGRDTSGTPQATGVYFYQLSIDGAAVEMKKLVLLR